VTDRQVQKILPSKTPEGAGRRIIRPEPKPSPKGGLFSRHRPVPSPIMRRAVIDVGSGSVLTLIAERTDQGWNLVQETSEVTALGEGTKQTGALGEPGMAATLAALQRGFELARALGAESTQAAATMAVRIAANAPAFLERASAQGTPLRVLSAEEEAQFAFRAAAQDRAFAQSPRLTVVDPGGQSTEIVCAARAGDDWQIHFERSFPLGTLGLRGGILEMESPDVPAIFRASSWIDDILGDSLPPLDGGTVVVLGAPATDLVVLRESMNVWDPERVHGQTLDYEEIGRAVGWLMRMTDDERARLPGITPGRHRTVHIGALVLERILNAVAAPECRVSVRGWRWALLDEPIPR